MSTFHHPPVLISPTLAIPSSFGSLNCKRMGQWSLPLTADVSHWRSFSWIQKKVNSDPPRVVMLIPSLKLTFFSPLETGGKPPGSLEITIWKPPCLKLLVLVSGMVIHQPGLPVKKHAQIILKLRYPKNGADIIYLLVSLGFFVLLSWFSLEMECLQDILAFNHKEL